MPEWYIVKYKTSNKEYSEMLVYAYDEENAREVGGVQLRINGHGRATIVSVRKEGEKDKEFEEIKNKLVFKIS